MKSIDKILKRYWGYDTFRPLQREIIESVISRRDTIALMPTGGGKSITFQVAALAQEGICIVVTPLISLMKDQIDSLRKKKILAKSVHGGMSKKEIDIILDNCVYGDYKFLYVSPERLETDLFRTRVEKMNVSMIAIDEAHCISQWGYDFRPSYLNIAQIRPLAPNATVLAVTATATGEVVKDIEDKLKLYNPKTFKMSFARPNISYVVRKAEDKQSMILKIINAVEGSAIIYCQTRKGCEEMAQFLQSQNFSVDFYHGGLSYQLRNVKQEQWINNEKRIMVATNAFGMGIDKHDVRIVIHKDTPSTLEAYYQEAGRAGRDGKPSYAVLLTDKYDKNAALNRINNEYPSISDIKKIYSLICNYLNVGIGEGLDMTFDFNIYDFCSKFRLFSAPVLSALNILELCNYLSVTDNIDSPTRIQFITSRESLYRIQLLYSDLENFISILLRTYTGLFTQFVSIDEKYLSYISGYSIQYISEAFKKLGILKMISYIPSRKTPLIIFKTERLTEDNIRIDTNQYSLRKKQTLRKLDSVIEYCESITKCRSLIMQNYFGEESEKECGLCDICRSKIKQQSQLYQQNRMAAVKELVVKIISEKPIDIKALTLRIKASNSSIEKSIKELLDQQIIEFIPFESKLRIRDKKIEQ